MGCDWERIYQFLPQKKALYYRLAGDSNLQKNWETALDEYIDSLKWWSLRPSTLIRILFARFPRIYEITIDFPYGPTNH